MDVPEQEAGRARGKLPNVLKVGKQASLNLSSHLPSSQTKTPALGDPETRAQHPPAHCSAGESRFLP